MSDTPDFIELQRLKAEAARMRDEAAAYHAAAEKKLADATYALGQFEHRHRLTMDTERGIAERERHLKEDLHEDALLARERAVTARETAAHARDVESCAN